MDDLNDLNREDVIKLKVLLQIVKQDNPLLVPQLGCLHYYSSRGESKSIIK